MPTKDVIVRAVRLLPDHCKRGHLYTPENTRVTAEGRICRACIRRRTKEFRARQRAKKLASAA